jgi:hypothetical protein
MCNKRRICKQESCTLRFKKSFASHFRCRMWDYKKNNGRPIDYFKSARIFAWFICTDCNHSFELLLNNITNGSQWCGFCNSNNLCENYDCNFCFEKSFSSCEKSKLWNTTKNKKNPRQISKYCNKSGWFTCTNCNHDYKVAIVSATRGHGCSYCYNRAICKSTKNCEMCISKSFFNIERSKLLTNNPINNFNPKEIFKNTRRKAEFECNICCHKFTTTVSSVSQGYWCPYCGYQVMCYEDDCYFCFERSIESHPYSVNWSIKNDINSRTVPKYSNTKYLFNCPDCDKEFDITPSHIMEGKRCRYCLFKNEKETREIFERLTGFDFIKTQKQLVNGYELDGYCEELSLAFEYDGESHYNYIKHFHRKGIHMLIHQQVKDFIKTRTCKQLNIHLIRIPYFIKDKEKFIEKKLKKLSFV